MTKHAFITALAIAALAIGIVSCNHSASPTQPTPVCTITIAPANLTLSGEGGSGTVNVTAPAGCEWSATASASWITITSGATGSGTGTVGYSVAGNPAADTRSGTLTIGGQSHAITQQGRSATACTYDLSPGSADYNKDGGTGTFVVTAPAGCAWTAISAAPWLAITTAGQGSGTGQVTYTVARQTEIAERNAAITVAERRFMVRQAGDAGVCQYGVNPVEFKPCLGGGTLTAAITTSPSCPWTVSSGAGWLTVPSGGSGNGSANISIAFTDNFDAPRDGVVMVRWPTPTAGQNIRVAQAGCLYAVSRSAISVGSAGGTASFDVFQQSDPNTCGGATQDRCVWTARSDAPWITVTSSMPRSGDNPVSFTVAPNDSTAPRVGTITVRDKVVTITQAGHP